MAKHNTWFRKLGHWFNNLKVPSFADSLLQKAGKAVDSLFNQVTASGATGRDKELSDISFQNARQLANEDYERKIDFYEQFESPAAMVRQYKDAGLNPALMYGNGASVSASGGVGTGSAQAADASSALGSVLSSILGAAMQSKRIETDRILTSDRNDIDRFEAQTRRAQAENYAAYLRELTRGKQMENDTFYSMFGLRQQEIESNIALKNSQTEYFVQVANSEGVRRQLMQSGIRLNDASTAVAEVQKAILEAQAKYSDKYFKALADVQDAMSRVSNIDAGVYERMNDKDLLYHGSVAELANMIFNAGMTKDIWEGDAFKKSVSGKMTDKDWTQTVIGVLKALVAGGAVVGATALRASSRAIVPPMTATSTSGMNYSYAPRMY